MTNIKVFHLIAIGVSVAAASLSSAQGVSVERYRTKGFTLGASMSAGSMGATFKLTEYVNSGGQTTPGVAVFGSAMGFTPAGLAVYTADSNVAATGNLIGCGPSLIGQSCGSVTVPGRKLVFSPGSFIPTVSYGTLTIEATLVTNGGSYVSTQPYHNDLSLPGYGMVFEYTQMITGRMTDVGYGQGGAYWTEAGSTTALVPAGTPTSTLLLGYVHEGSIVISRN